jgi:hypothetical protein
MHRQGSASVLLYLRTSCERSDEGVIRFLRACLQVVLRTNPPYLKNETSPEWALEWATFLLSGTDLEHSMGLLQQSHSMTCSPSVL